MLYLYLYYVEHINLPVIGLMIFGSLGLRCLLLISILLLLLLIFYYSSSSGGTNMGRIQQQQ